MSTLLRSYWVPKDGTSRWSPEGMKEPLVPGALTHLEGDLSKETIDLILIRRRLKEIEYRTATNNHEYELVPVDYQFAPMYDDNGRLIPTANDKTRQRLQLERDALNEIALPSNKLVKEQESAVLAPGVKKTFKYFLPESKDPSVNVLGLLIGPRGNSLRKLQNQTGTTITIRGKGSSRSRREAGESLPGDDEELHAYIQADTDEQIKRTVSLIKNILFNPVVQNEFRKEQLRQLNYMEGTDSENVPLVCLYCGATNHTTDQCPSNTLLFDDGSGNNDDLEAFLKDTMHLNENGEDDENLDLNGAFSLNLDDTRNSELKENPMRAYQSAMLKLYSGDETFHY
ncbi:putative Branchpoint-bridging protein [Blattamonas nauphoetae]|uniref:Branchpoint-bridging protein n=1 Tax=Blattamonas nauphoetae TaxID=2049346 RepID=A0ABQ9X2S7_9EUKA|nr:putative Branchpoint-bridging protein [Blattamonas nauphoetae]